MRNAAVSVVPDAIRIEDEVWQDAFARRERADRRPRDSSSLDRERPPAGALGPRPVPAPAPLPPPLPEALARSAAAADRRRARPPANPAPARPAPVHPAPVGASASGRAAEPATGRRTVTIRGRGAEGHLPWPGEGRAQRSRRPHERHGFRPDRFAMWAVFLGLLLIAVAVASPHS